MFESEIIKSAIQQGIGYALFIWLFIRTDKRNEEREQRYIDRENKYQQIIDELAQKLNIVHDVKETVDEIKKELNV